MTPSQEANPKSPWMTIWLSPRQAIDDVLATRPRHFGLAACEPWHDRGLFGQLAGLGFASHLLDWRFLLGFIVASAIFGVAWLYLAGAVFGWIGRLVGGHASALEVRAVFAWSAVPSIVGLVATLLLLASWRVSGGESVTATGNLPLLAQIIAAVCGLWSFIVFFLMLSRVERFGFWRGSQFMCWACFCRWRSRC
jgi:signal peptidase I